MSCDCESQLAGVPDTGIVGNRRLADDSMSQSRLSSQAGGFIYVSFKVEGWHVVAKQKL